MPFAWGKLNFRVLALKDAPDRASEKFAIGREPAGGERA